MKALLLAIGLSTILTSGGATAGAIQGGAAGAAATISSNLHGLPPVPKAQAATKEQELQKLALALQDAISKVVAKLEPDVGPMKNVKVSISTLTGRAVVSMDNDKKGPVTFMFVVQDDGSWGVADYFVPMDMKRFGK